MKKLTTIFASLFIASAACATEQHGGQHGNPGSDDRKTTQTTSVSQSSRSESSALSRSSSKSRSSANSFASGGNGAGSAEALGGSANATGGQVVVSASGSGSGLTGRMVPDVSSTAPITSTSCRNGVTAGGSGNGWGGLLGFFSEDDMCEWRLLEADYRATGDHDKANAIRSGMTAQRCKKLAPEDREAFGDLCPKPPAQGSHGAAFSSAG